MHSKQSQSIGRYQVKEELGRGGMATVFLAYDPRFEREVAVKLLPREFLHDPTFTGRFEREAKTIAALEHSAIVPVYDVGEQEGQPYLVMRYMPGGSLIDRMREGPITLQEVSMMLNRLAPGLDKAHSSGIVHRDLKPANILLDAEGDPYLSDFGIVKLAESTATYTGSGVIGTPSYMSPEQAQGAGQLDGRSDIYALGTIIFELLTGKPPYEADTPMGVAIKHVTEPVPNILEANPDLPQAIEPVMQQALAKSPDDRYQTASAFAHAVSNVLASLQTIGGVKAAATVVVPTAEETPEEVAPTIKAEEPEILEPQAETPVEKPQAIAPTVHVEEPAAEVVEEAAMPDDDVSKEAEAVEPAVLEAATVVAEEKPQAPTEQEPIEPEPAERKRFPIWAPILGVIVVVVIALGLVFGGRSLLAPEPTPTNRPPTNTPVRADTVAATEAPPPEEPAAFEPLPFDPGALVVTHEFFTEPNQVGDLTWAPDGSRIAWIGTFGEFPDSDTLGIFAVTDGLEPVHLLSTNTNRTEDIAWSPDGSKLATSGANGTVQIWDPETGEVINEIQVSTAVVRALAWSPDSQFLATGDGTGNIVVWEMETGEAVRELCCHTFVVSNAGGLEFSLDGRLLLSAGADAKVLAWDWETGEIVQEFCCHNTEWVRQAAWSPEMERIVSGSHSGGGGGSLIIWDMGAGEPIHEFAEPERGFLTVDWAPIEPWIASGDSLGTLRIWQADAGEEVAVYDFVPADFEPRSVYSATWSPEGERIASFSADGVLRIWGMPLEPAPAAGPVGDFSACLVIQTGSIEVPFNATIWNGITQAQEQLGIEAIFVETDSSGQSEVEMNQMVEQGCDLIIGAGFQLADPLRRTALRNPDQRFTIVDWEYDPPIDNVIAQYFATDQAAFLAGYLAAGLSQTGKVGTYGGMDIPTVTIFMDGFALGVQKYNEDHGTQVEVIGWDLAQGQGEFLGNFDNNVQGQQLAQEFIEAGADILFPPAGAAGGGAGDAILEDNSYVLIYRDEGASICGTDADGGPLYAGEGIWRGEAVETTLSLTNFQFTCLAENEFETQPFSYTLTYDPELDRLTDSQGLEWARMGEKPFVASGQPFAGAVGTWESEDSDGSYQTLRIRNGVLLIGVDVDWFQLYPQFEVFTLSSVLKKMDVSTFEVIAAAVEGRFEGGTYVATLENQGVGLAPFYFLEPFVPEELYGELEALAEAIMAGEVQTRP
jgi:serine/threonine-protein kinase